MLFRDFHIVAVAEDRSCLAQQIHHQIDANGHVAGTKDRNFRRSGAHFCKLLLAVAGGADDNRCLSLLAIIQQHFE